MSDFVEYCYGDINQTIFGKLRNNGGHPDIYNVSWIEIGNEQGLDDKLLSDIINITKAMDAKARELNIPLFRYCIGQNLNNGQLNGACHDFFF